MRLENKTAFVTGAEFSLGGDSTIQQDIRYTAAAITIVAAV